MANEAILARKGGSVRDRASKYNQFFWIGMGGRLCGFQDGQDGYRAAEEL